VEEFNMDAAITVETEIFEHREVKPHFINPCCFGEDFAAWWKKEIAALGGSGFSFSEIIQEDYGWGFWAWRGGDPFWVALSYVGDGLDATSNAILQPQRWESSTTRSTQLRLRPETTTFPPIAPPSTAKCTDNSPGSLDRAIPECWAALHSLPSAYRDRCRSR
jgi:hypothetical protein